MENIIEVMKEYGKVNAEYIKKADIAREAFLSGYNCSQAILAAFANNLNISQKEALRLAQPFGGGLSRLREVCGAVSGGSLVLGGLFGSDDAKDYQQKKAVYELTQKYIKRFASINGSYICRELLGLGDKICTFTPDKRCEEYYKKRPCADLVWISAMLVAQIIDEE